MSGSDLESFEMFEYLTKGKPPLVAWHRVGGTLALEMAFNNKNYPINSPESELEMRENLEQAGVDLKTRREIVDRVWELKRTKREKIDGILDLNTTLAQRIMEEIRELARVQDSEETRKMADFENAKSLQPNVTIVGDVLGTVNLGSITGNIYSSVTKLSQDPSTRRIADVLKWLTESITKDSRLDPEQKVDALQTVETLSEQAKLPETERKPPAFKAALGYLSSILCSVETGAKIWHDLGPALRGFFN